MLGDSDYRKPIGGEDSSSTTSDSGFQGYGGSTPEARHQHEDNWGYHHKEDYKFQGGSQKKSRNYNQNNQGAIDPQTGKYYPPTGDGVFDPQTGKYYPKSGDSGYIDPETGKFYPKQ
jgi:hypothetical protein